MSIKRYLLLGERKQDCTQITTSLIASSSSLSSKNEEQSLSDFEDLFYLKDVDKYQSSIVREYQENLEGGNNLLIITYGSKMFVLPESLSGINELFQNQNSLKQNMYKASNSFLQDLMKDQVNRLTDQEFIRMEVRFYCQEDDGQTERVHQMDVQTIQEMTNGLMSFAQNKAGSSPFSNKIFRASKINKETSQTTSTLMLVELSLCTKQLSLQHDIIINHTLDSIYKYICKGDQNASIECKITKQVADVLTKTTKVLMVGYCATIEGGKEETNKILEFIRRFRSLVEAKNQEIFLKKWKPSFSKELKESFQSQIGKTKHQVASLKTQLRVLESDVMKIWCGQLNLSKKQMLDSTTIKKVIDYEEVSKAIKEIQQLTQQYSEVQKEAQQLEQRITSLKDEPQPYDMRIKPVTQTEKTKKQFCEIRLLEAEIQKQRKLKLAQINEQESTLLDMPLQSKFTHPKSAQTRKLQPKFTHSRPLTGLPNLANQTSIGMSTRPFTGITSITKQSLLSKTRHQNRPSSSMSKTIACPQNLDEASISKAYSSKFKIERDSYIKHHETLLKQTVESGDATIQKHRALLQSAILQAKQIIDRQNKIMMLRDENSRQIRLQEQLIKKQLEINSLSRLNRRVVKKSIS